MPVVLGTIAFLGHEIPASINFGGAQMIRAHKYGGGRRVIDAMGPDDDDLKWSGHFEGLTASIRARQVDLLRRSGKMVTLIWSTFVYKVIVVKFEADFEASYKIPYKITCVVVSDVVAEKVAPFVQRIEDFVTGGISDALGISADDTTLFPIVGGVQTAVQNVVTSGSLDFSTVSSSAMAGLSSYMGNSLTAVQANTEVVSSGLTADGGLGSAVAPAADPIAAGTRLTGIAEAADGAYRSQAVEVLLTNLRNNVRGVGR